MLLQFLQGNITQIEFVFGLVALIVSLSIHEFAHALVATRLGDPTPRMLGRLTINPAAHLDPVGSILLLLTGFGWGKPVPINPTQIKGGRRGVAWVSLAGPASNFLLAIFFGLLLRFRLFPANSLFPDLALVFVSLNVGLMVFNLLPFGPLDGFKIAMGFLPSKTAFNLARSNIQSQMIVMYVIALFVFPYIANFVLNWFWKIVVGF